MNKQEKEDLFPGEAPTAGTYIYKTLSLYLIIFSS